MIIDDGDTKKSAHFIPGAMSKIRILDKAKAFRISRSLEEK